MAQKTVDIEVSAIFSFKYDPESPEFKATLDRFKKVIDKGGNEENLITYVAQEVRTCRSVFHHIPVVGFLQKEGYNPPIREFSGIAVEEPNPDFNYEIL